MPSTVSPGRIGTLGLIMLIRALTGVSTLLYMSDVELCRPFFS